jgi:hypothetical protein
MERLSAAERADDSFKSYYFAWACILESAIRRGAMLPDPGRPEQVRWAAEGAVAPSLLETVRGLL